MDPTAPLLVSALLLGLATGGVLGTTRLPGIGPLLMTAVILPPGAVGLWIHLGGGAWPTAAIAVIGFLTTTALVRRALAPTWSRLGTALLLAGVSRRRALPPLFWTARRGVALALLAGAARMAAEAGGAMLALGGDPYMPLVLLAIGAATTAAALAIRP